MTKIKLIIDTDPGVDDAMAIAMTAAMPVFDLLALTTIFGNTFVHQSSRNARYLADRLGLDVPVAEGAALPYGHADYTPAANVHGPEGFGDMDQVPDIGANAAETAPELLCRMAREMPGEVILCAIGPLTNVADALKLDPDFAANLGRLVIMGGAYDHPGNITPQAEANIWHDAAAADAVFASELDIQMIGLNATLQTLISPADLVELADAAPETGGFLAHISDFYLGFYRSVGVHDGCPMHDALAVLACAHPEKFSFTDMGLTVPTSGEMLGATLADPARKPVQIATSCAAEWAVTTFKEAIKTLP